MDAAAAAAQSWPPENPAFRRAWCWPPPRNRNGAALHHQHHPAIEKQTTAARYTDPAAVAQRACASALRRAGELERRAGTLASIGQRDAAVRLLALAAELREAIA
jgi:hypothetical protein